MITPEDDQSMGESAWGKKKHGTIFTLTWPSNIEKNTTWETTIKNYW